MAEMEMTIFYNDKVTPIAIGDVIEFRGGFTLLFKKFSGQVFYIPGLSKKNSSYERDGLCWVGINLPEKAKVLCLIDPDTNSLMKRDVKFIRRGVLDSANALAAEEFVPDN
jgi:hypothetical protein